VSVVGSNVVEDVMQRGTENGDVFGTTGVDFLGKQDADEGSVEVGECLGLFGDYDVVVLLEGELDGELSAGGALLGSGLEGNSNRIPGWKNVNSGADNCGGDVREKVVGKTVVLKGGQAE